MRSIKVYATRISRSVGWSSWSIFTATRTSRSSPPSRRNWRYGDDFEVANRPAAGVITRRPEEPYTTSVRTVLWEPGRVTAPATRAIGACAPLGRGSCSFSALALEAVAEAPAFVAGVDDVRAMGQPVDDGLREPGVGEHLRPFPERQVRRDDQAAAFVSFGEDLEDEFGGAVGQGQVAQLVTEQKLGAGVACDDAGELAVALGFLELVRESGEGGEPDAAALVAGADRQGCGQHRLASPAVADEDHRLAVIDPGSFRQGGDRGLRDLRVVLEAEILEAFDVREPCVDQAAFLASLGAFGHLGLEQRGEIRDRGLLLAERFRGQRPEASADSRELQLDSVRLDQRLQCGGLRVSGGGGHRSSSRWRVSLSACSAMTSSPNARSRACPAVRSQIAGSCWHMSSVIITVTNWQSTPSSIQSIWCCSMNASIEQYGSGPVIVPAPDHAAGRSVRGHRPGGHAPAGAPPGRSVAPQRQPGRLGRGGRGQRPRDRRSRPRSARRG